jgi:hypothetical protein
MNSVEATAAVIDALEAGHIDYMVVGAYSANAYGIGRSTNDADIVVSITSDQMHELRSRLGPDFRFDRQLQMEAFTGSYRNVITYIPTKFQIELFRLNQQDDHHRERFQRRRRILLAEVNRETWLPTAEDVIIQKLRWQRRKDLDDCVNIIAVNGPRLDWEYINAWAAKHGTLKLLQELQRSIPDLGDL